MYIVNYGFSHPTIYIYDTLINPLESNSKSKLIKGWEYIQIHSYIQRLKNLDNI
jgi:hypothetical protein